MAYWNYSIAIINAFIDSSYIECNVYVDLDFISELHFNLQSRFDLFLIFHYQIVRQTNSDVVMDNASLQVHSVMAILNVLMEVTKFVAVSKRTIAFYISIHKYINSSILCLYSNCVRVNIQ